MDVIDQVKDFGLLVALVQPNAVKLEIECPDEVWLTLLQETYTRDQVYGLLELVLEGDPDEIEIVADRLRLWWD